MRDWEWEYVFVFKNSDFGTKEEFITAEEAEALYPLLFKYEKGVNEEELNAHRDIELSTFMECFQMLESKPDDENYKRFNKGGRFIKKTPPSQEPYWVEQPDTGNLIN